MSELSSAPTATTTTATTTIHRRTTMGNRISNTNQNTAMKKFGPRGGGNHGHGPAYQIDRQLTHKGKMIAGTKRRVYWKFGFADRDALSSGNKSSIDCRGQEHEIVFVWSLTSGKQLVLADGHEVHWGKTRSLEKFVKTWRMDGGHEIKVVAHASSPLLFDNNTSSDNASSGGNTSKQFKQYDLIVDGVSFSDMPQICDLGSSSTGSSSSYCAGTCTATSSSLKSSNSSSSLSSPSPQHGHVHHQQQRHSSSGSRRITPMANVRRNLKHYSSQPLPHDDDELDNTETESLSPSPSMPDLLDAFDQTKSSTNGATAHSSTQPQHALHATTSTPSFPSHHHHHQQQQHMYPSQSCFNINLLNMDSSFVSPQRTMYPHPTGGGSSSAGAATAAVTLPSHHYPQYATMAVNAMNAADSNTNSAFGSSPFSSSSSCLTPSTVGLTTPSPVYHHHHELLSRTSPRSVQEQIIGTMATDGTASPPPSSNPFDAFVVSAPKLPSDAHSVQAATVATAATDFTTSPWR